MKGKNIIEFYSYLQCILFKLCILVYNLENTAICNNFNYDKVYAHFNVNSFSPEIMVVLNLGHLEGLKWSRDQTCQTCNVSKRCYFFVVKEQC